MKQNIIKQLLSIVIISCAVLPWSCNKDNNLNVINQAAISADNAFSSESSSDLVLNNIYATIPDLNDYMYDMFENWSDNMMTPATWEPTYVVFRNMSTITASTQLYDTWAQPYSQTFFYWSSLYANVRKCNVYIQGMKTATGLPATFVNERLGEAYALRAFFYQYLWIYYGGVPLISIPDNNITQGNAVFHARSSSDSTFAFIEATLDTAIQLLPVNTGNSGNGHLTMGSALAIKGWGELFYASALKNPANDLNRWATAAATNKQIMSMGYSLYPKYNELFLQTGNTNQEGIWYRQYVGGTLAGSNIIQMNGPATIGSRGLSWGDANPTQDLVDDYAMANGKAITDAGSGYDPQNPYANRDPRFYQSIIWNGSTFADSSFTTYVGKINGVSANNPFIVNNAGANITGYAMRKRLDTTVANIFGVDLYSNGPNTSSQNFYYFRYAEILLSYAEAQNEAVGPDATVYGALDQIRTRAGIPTASVVYPGLNQTQMRALIRKERRIEMAFEEKRYYDLLRWKTAEVVLNGPMHGMLITPNASAPTGFDYQTVVVAQRVFDAAKNYVLPIPPTAIQQNPALQGHQNPNY